mmetsp:Transcript_2102/g.4748  ORF Transcript_2102/g.4748 Transcript_2102/m.4748 type:complete len:388 (-) Transcript_2102:205-1368(-)
MSGMGIAPLDESPVPPSIVTPPSTFSSVRSPGERRPGWQRHRASIGGGLPSSTVPLTQPSVNPRLRLRPPVTGLDVHSTHSSNAKAPARRYSLPDFNEDDCIDSISAKPQPIHMAMRSRSFDVTDPPSSSNQRISGQQRRGSTSGCQGFIVQPDDEITASIPRQRSRGSVSNGSRGASGTPRQQRRGSTSGCQGFIVQPDDEITASSPRQRSGGSVSNGSRGASGTPRQQRRGSTSGCQELIVTQPDDEIIASTPRQRRRGSVSNGSRGASGTRRQNRRGSMKASRGFATQPSSADTSTRHTISAPRHGRRSSISGVSQGPISQPDSSSDTTTGTLGTFRQRRRGSMPSVSQGLLTSPQANGETSVRQSFEFLRESLGTMHAEAPKW